jgi:hypothetical protein
MAFTTRLIAISRSLGTYSVLSQFDGLWEFSELRRDLIDLLTCPTEGIDIRTIVGRRNPSLHDSLRER